MIEPSRKPFLPVGGIVSRTLTAAIEARDERHPRVLTGLDDWLSYAWAFGFAVGSAAQGYVHLRMSRDPSLRRSGDTWIVGGE